jgi:hypothetical protein
LVYLVLGWLALQAALGNGGDVTDQRGAVEFVGNRAFGQVLLTLLALGLLGFAYLRIWEGVSNPSNYDHNAKGAAARVGLVLSGLAKVMLALYALSLAFGWFSGLAGSGGGSTADFTARLMAAPAGRWLVAAVGAGMCVSAVNQLKTAITASFLEELRISGAQRRWVTPLGRAGFAARFVVFAIIGVAIMIAAWKTDPDEAVGLAGALQTLRAQAYGAWLLGAVGVGFIAFAVVRGVYARYGVLPDQQDKSGGQ